jgi:hypothetical protein
MARAVKNWVLLAVCLLMMAAAVAMRMWDVAALNERMDRLEALVLADRRATWVVDLETGEIKRRPNGQEPPK